MTLTNPAPALAVKMATGAAEQPLMNATDYLRYASRDGCVVDLRYALKHLDAAAIIIRAALADLDGPATVEAAE